MGLIFKINLFEKESGEERRSRGSGGQREKQAPSHDPGIVA